MEPLWAVDAEPIETQATPRPVRAGSSDSAAPQPTLQVSWAREACEVPQAQRLRHQVFVREMGARPVALPGAPPGHDVDRFDAFCEHLLLRAGGLGDGPGPVAGTCRVLTPAAAARAGGLYSDTEFDLSPPAWDPDFKTADLPLMTRLPELPARYRRHFLGA